MAELLRNIGMLVTLDGEDATDLAAIEDAAVVMEGGSIAWIGSSTARPRRIPSSMPAAVA